MAASELLSVVRQQATAVPVGAELAALREELKRRYGDSLSAILFYGSCLRGGDPLDGLVDLYVLVDGYRLAYGELRLAVLNRLLPPNVFYLELPLGEQRIRSKYAVLSMQHLRDGTSPRWFHSYLWGRFAQPVGVLYVRDDETSEQVNGALTRAVLTFVSRTLPRLPPRFSARELWEQGLALSYGAELRAERSSRNTELFASYRQHYEDLTRAALAETAYFVHPQGDGAPAVYTAQIPARARRLSRLAWAVRSVQGKLLSLARLVKAVLTFHGGVDYILWKLERHSGVRVEPSEKVRRHPLIYGWGLLWTLYRRGAFR